MLSTWHILIGLIWRADFNLIQEVHLQALESFSKIPEVAQLKRKPQIGLTTLPYRIPPPPPPPLLFKGNENDIYNDGDKSQDRWNCIE